MLGEGSSLWSGDTLKARGILPWMRGGIEGGGEGEGEGVIGPRSGIVPVGVERARIAAVNKKGVIDDSDGLAASREC